MLYRILKIWVRCSSLLFCRKIVITRRQQLQADGPLLLAANHPNSFLDAILLDILFDKPIWSLARGDAFKKPFYIKLLTKLKIMPVYRSTEGVENLETNYKTFDACREIFRNKGVVLMFSEGRCINEWHLRPLKKGTARLAISCWQEEIPVNVLPVGINYSSFTRFGKNVFLHFGTTITMNDIDLNATDGKRNLMFNERLQHELQQLVYEIPKSDLEQQEEKLAIRPSLLKRIVLVLPALVGLLLHAPVYLPVRAFTRFRTKDTDHFDSVVTGMLIIFYPLYLLLATTFAWMITGTALSLLVVLVVPFTAWSYVQLKGQLDPQVSRDPA